MQPVRTFSTNGTQYQSKLSGPSLWMGHNTNASWQDLLYEWDTIPIQAVRTFPMNRTQYPCKLSEPSLWMGHNTSASCQDLLHEQGHNTNASCQDLPPVFPAWTVTSTPLDIARAGAQTLRLIASDCPWFYNPFPWCITTGQHLSWKSSPKWSGWVFPPKQ